MKLIMPMLTYDQRYYQANRDRILTRQAVYNAYTYQTRAEHRRAASKRWYDKNREAVLLAQKCGVGIAEARRLLKEKAA